MKMDLTTQRFVGDYLERLQYSGPVLPNLETLKTLHHRHMLTIPFENLNNVLKEEYSYTKEDLYKKIILGQRGGVCYELNSLFAFLLQDLGFKVTIIGASVLDKINKNFPKSPNHQFSIIELEEEKWIVNVGFFDSFTVPLRLVEDEVQDGGHGVYRLRRVVDGDHRGWISLENQIPNDTIISYAGLPLDVENKPDVWKSQYKFTLRPCTVADFTQVRNLMLKSPESPLNNGLLCTMLRSWGRITLSRFKVVKKFIESDGKVTKKEVVLLENEEEVWSVLKKEFGVQLEKKVKL